MAISTATILMFDAIESKIIGNIRSKVTNIHDREDLVSYITLGFLEKDHPIFLECNVKTEADIARIGTAYTEVEAYGYCVGYLFKEARKALFQEDDYTTGQRGGLAEALRVATTPEEVDTAKKSYTASKKTTSFDVIVENGGTPAGYSVNTDPLNPMGMNEDLLEYLESSAVDPTAKEMVKKSLREELDQKELAVFFGISEQSVPRHMAREAVKIGSRGERREICTATTRMAKTIAITAAKEVGSEELVAAAVAIRTVDMIIAVLSNPAVAAVAERLVAELIADNQVKRINRIEKDTLVEIQAICGKAFKAAAAANVVVVTPVLAPVVVLPVLIAAAKPVVISPAALAAAAKTAADLLAPINLVLPVVAAMAGSLKSRKELSSSNGPFAAKAGKIVDIHHRHAA